VQNSDGMGRPRSELQIKPKKPPLTCASVDLRNCVSSPPSALRIGKFGKRQSLEISIIHEVFGENVTLYQVLDIKPSATGADVRKAYISAGKKALLNGGISTDAGWTPCELVDVPEAARKRFQAISRAYEIISTPELRSEYDMYLYGVVHVQSQSQLSSTSGSVEWSAYVEQKIFHDEQLYGNDECMIEESRSDEHSCRPNSAEANKRQTSSQGRMHQGNSLLYPIPRSLTCMDIINGGCIGLFD
jgi:DnaJ-class molecular chaperone